MGNRPTASSSPMPCASHQSTTPSSAAPAGRTGSTRTAPRRDRPRSGSRDREPPPRACRARRRAPRCRRRCRPGAVPPCNRCGAPGSVHIPTRTPSTPSAIGTLSPVAEGLDPPDGVEAELPRLRQRQHRVEQHSGCTRDAARRRCRRCGPCSTTKPACITMTSSHTYCTTARSWLMSM